MNTFGTLEATACSARTAKPSLQGKYVQAIGAAPAARLCQPVMSHLPTAFAVLLFWFF